MTDEKFNEDEIQEIIRFAYEQFDKQNPNVSSDTRAKARQSIIKMANRMRKPS